MPLYEKRLSNLLWIIIAVLLLVFLLWALNLADAHEHQAGETSEQARVINFYKSWTRPKGDFSIPHRTASCCYAMGANQDCFPVLATRRAPDGVLEVTPDVSEAPTDAQITFGGVWVRLDHHIDEDQQLDPRESPDGRSHVCITPASHIAVCYVAGYGN